VHGDGLADDEAIFDELADGLAGVGVADFALFVGIKPDLALAAADHRGRKALLGAEIDPIVHTYGQLHDGASARRGGAGVRRLHAARRLRNVACGAQESW
jgi:hypothetical protein